MDLPASSSRNLSPFPQISKVLHYYLVARERGSSCLPWASTKFRLVMQISICYWARKEKSVRVWILLVNTVIRKHLNTKCINQVHSLNQAGNLDSCHFQRNLTHSRSHRQALLCFLFSLLSHKTYPSWRVIHTQQQRIERLNPSLAWLSRLQLEVKHLLICTLLANIHVLKYLMQISNHFLKWEVGFEGKEAGRTSPATCYWVAYKRD